MSGLCFYLLFVKLITNVNVPFSGVVLGAFGTRFVKQAVLWPPDLHEVSQCGVGFLLGQEVQGLVTQSTAVSVPGLPLCRLTSVGAQQSVCWAPAVQTDFSSFLCVES